MHKETEFIFRYFLTDVNTTEAIKVILSLDGKLSYYIYLYVVHLFKFLFRIRSNSNNQQPT